MSYIGKNPKVDSVKLDGSATEPSGTAVDGQVYFNTGTGSISKGMKVYKNSQFVAIDKQLGDADTMQLLKAADIPAIDFNLSYTSTTVGGNNAVPFESSTGDFDGTAAFTNSSTGDALLTDDSADLVFHYTTEASNSADNDFWGIPLTVPRAFRGGNLVLEFKYRTEIATGTMDDGYFNIAIQDRSAMILQTQDSTISAGAIAAGSDVLLDGKTYSNPVTGTTLTVAVGDRVFVESGTGAAGDQANDIVDCYITEVSSTTNNVKLSKDIVAVQDGKFVTGWLTGYDTGGQIDAFASDTNKDGTSKKLAFKTDADTQQVSLWFFVKGTSTVKHELFFDNVLLSGNKFLQASSQTKSESYSAAYQNNFLDSTSTGFLWGPTLPLPIGGSPPLADSKFVSIGDITSGTDTVTAITAKQDITLSVTIGFDGQATGEIKIYNSDAGIIGMQGPVAGTVTLLESSVTVNLSKDDYIYFNFKNPNSAYGFITFTAQPQTSDVILLESQDEIFTDWTEYSITAMKKSGSNATHNGTFGGTVNLNKAYWRRVGSDMEIKWNFRQTATGTNGTDGVYVVPLPDGYSIDMSKVGNTDYAATGYAGVVVGVGKISDVVATLTPTTMPAFPSVTENVSWGLTIQWQGVSGGSADDLFVMWSDSDLGLATQNLSLSMVAKVPIQGWNSNFNPLMSMPLVDFGSFENVYSALIDNNGTATITTESRPFIKSVTRSATGVVAIVFKDDFFTQPPVVTVTPSGYDVGSSDYSASCYSVSSTGVTVKCEATGAGGDTDRDFSIVVQRQSSDYRDPPQPTAAVIKPAVAILYDQKPSTTAGGTAGTAGFYTRTLNTAKGETWFVSINSTNNGFTLDPGMYEIDFSAPTYSINNNQARLYDTTNSVVVQNGMNAYTNSSYNGSMASSGKAVITVTSATEYKIEHYIGTGSVSGGALGVDVGSATYSIYTTVKISKLK